MNTLETTSQSRSIWVQFTALLTILTSCSLAEANPDYSFDDFDLWPTSIVQGSATPKVMINASNDHQLYFKAYNDYSDLDYDGTADTTYDTAIDYYGYFDSTKCYEYVPAESRFEPRDFTDNKHYCSGVLDDYWSGNFLNWASMSRIDVIRKILFGGHRRVDTATETVLERSYLPLSRPRNGSRTIPDVGQPARIQVSTSGSGKTAK